MLNLSKNQLSSLPAEIGNLIQLKQLYLYNNQLNIASRNREINTAAKASSFKTNSVRFREIGNLYSCKGLSFSQPA